MMKIRYLFIVSFVIVASMLLSACAPGATTLPNPTQVSPATKAPNPTATLSPTATSATAPTPDQTAVLPTTAVTLPFVHTPCAKGVDLTGKTVSFYHILDPNDQVDTVYNPLRAGYADAAEYFNTHGGICGATLEHVFDETHWGDAQAVYDIFSALDPKPVVVTLYGSGDAVQLADKLAKDQIPALNIRGGSTASAYGEDEKTPGWVFATNPLYTDQVGAMCDYIVANPDRFPHPVMGFLNFEDAWANAATVEARPYCASLGIGDAGDYTFSGDDTYIQPHVQKLIDAGATIIYTNSHENGPALVARTLLEMGLQGKVTLATLNRAMDPYVAFSGEADLGADGLPAISGMLGSMPVRSLAETDNPGIQLIAAQADLHQRPPTLRTDGYIMGWDTTDLLIEVYIQTGNRVGFDHITGAEFKKTLENIVYAPLGGVEQIDYQGGKRRALAANRIGEMEYLGRDGKTPAGADNAPMVVAVGDRKVLVPMIVPLTDYKPAPDLRPGGADVPAMTVIGPTENPAATQAPTTAPAATAIKPTNTPVTTTSRAGLGTIKDRIAFQTDRDGNMEIYVMNGDGSGLKNLTNNPADDVEPAWSPDGKKIGFTSNRDGNDEIYVMNADGSGQKRLTNNPADDNQFRWSPNGKKILFTSTRDGNREIYVMNADGSNPVNLTNNPASDELPDWSPDGTKIVFSSDRGGLYVMNANGSHQTLLHTGSAGFPFWSPEGKKIAFYQDDGGNPEVYVMNSDGSNPTNLTNNPADDGVYGWSTDGTQIAFDSDRNQNRDIYMVNPDGSGLIRLTDNPAYDGAPSLSKP